MRGVAKGFKGLLFAVLLALLVLQIAPGQTSTATMTGTVTDASGSLVPGANITLTNELSGDVRKSQTNNAGYYSIAAVPVGTYSVTVDAAGFQKQVQKGIVLQSGDKVNLDSTMQVGSTSETVEVTATAESLTVDSGEKTAVLTQQALQSIATVGSSAAEFLKIMPGMAQTANGVSNAPAYSGETMGINGSGNAGRQSALGTFSANGTPTASMEITSDGAHVSDPGCNCATPVNPNGEMVQEVRVMTSAFTAENSKGPVVLGTITKAGGSQFHGGTYLNVRDYRINANDWLNNRNGLPVPSNKYYFPGGNVGGPVLIPGTNFNKNRDKLFFFSGFEYFYQSLTSGQVLASVPTAKMRAGDYSAAAIAELGPAGKVPGNPQAVSSAQVPGGIIPASQFDKGGQVMTNLLPLPNANPAQTGGFNYAQQVLFPQNGWQLVNRVDYSISDSTKLFARYYHQQELQNFPLALWGGNLGGAGNIASGANQLPYPTPVLGKNHSESLAGSLTRVFSASLTNSFTAAMAYVGFPNTFEDPTKIDRAKLGYPYKGFFSTSTSMIPMLIGNNSQTAAIANNGGLDTGKLSANKPSYSLADDVMWVRGTHTFKFGFYGEYYANIQPTYYTVAGSIQTDASSPISSGNAYADLMLGRVSQFTQANKNVIQRTGSYLYEFYLQDSWKITRNFSIDYGMRFQHDQQWFDRYGTGYAVWDPKTYSSDVGVAMSGVSWHSKDQSIPNAGFPNRALFVVPRFGMAWDAFGNGKLMVRGGIGQYRYRGPIINTGAISAPTGSYVQQLPTNAGSTLAQIDATPPPARSTRGTTLSLVNRQDDQMPQTWTYNFTLAYMAPKSVKIEAAYVGTKVRNVYEQAFHNVNAVPYGTFLKIANANSVRYDDYRPFPNYADVTIYTYDGYSDYNGMQLNVSHQSSRYTVMGNYTFSKVTGSGLNTNVIDTLNPSNNHGPLQFDRRHIFNVGYSAELPGPSKSLKVLNAVIGGWTASGVVQYQTGAPLQLNSTNNRFSMTLPKGVTNLNITGTNQVPAMPVLTCDPRSNLGPNQFLNGSCFTLPTAGNNGSIIEPAAAGPGFINADLSLFKTFKFAERKSLQFRLEGFNFLNHPNWSFGNDTNLNLTFDANGKQNNPNFGMVTNKLGHRILKLAVKFYF